MARILACSSILNNKALNRSKESGQSIIEFLLGLIIFLGGALFFIKLSMFISASNYVQYATFMAARAYKSSAATNEAQIARAMNLLARTVKRGGSKDRFRGLLEGKLAPNQVSASRVLGADVGPGQDYDANLRTSSWQDGVRYHFRGRFSLGRLGGSQGRGSGTGTEVLFTSEAWLGREPTVDECMRAIGDVYYDNGC